MRDILSLAGSLAVIVLLLFFTYYATRWYAGRVGRTVSGKYVKVLDRTVLSNSASLVIVQIGERYLLLGVSDKNIQMLRELDDFQQHVEPPSQSTNSFQQMLSSLMRKQPQSQEKNDNGGGE